MLARRMQEQRQDLASADARAADAIRAAIGALSTSLVRDQLSRIETEVTGLMDNHDGYSQWFISVVEQNVYEFAEYNRQVEREIRDWERDPLFTPRIS